MRVNDTRNGRTVEDGGSVTCGLKMLRMVVPFITQYSRMVRDTTATTTIAPSWAPLTESAVGLQLCWGLDSSAYL